MNDITGGMQSGACMQRSPLGSVPIGGNWFVLIRILTALRKDLSFREPPETVCAYELAVNCP